MLFSKHYPHEKEINLSRNDQKLLWRLRKLGETVVFPSEKLTNCIQFSHNCSYDFRCLF